MTSAPARPDRPATVLHYVQRWLPLSEAFVHDTLTRLPDRGVVVAATGRENRRTFPFRPTYSLGWVDRLPAGGRRRLRTLALLTLAARTQVQLVHVHFGYRVHDVVGLVRRRGLPLVVSLHGHDVTGFVRDWPGHYADAFADAAALVVPSAYLRGVVLDLGAPPDRVHVIPAGVDTTRLVPTPLPTRPDVVFVGRFVAKKGLDVLAAAWPQVRAAVPAARLHVAGYGPLEPVVRPVADRVTLSPTPGQVAAAIRAARVVVTPSRTGPDGDVESLLVVNLEAQAAGRPLVTTRHGGIPEFVAPDRSALLVDEADPAALAAALVRVLADEDLARSLAAGGPEVARRFDIGRSVAALSALYRQLTAGDVGAATRAG